MFICTDERDTSRQQLLAHELIALHSGQTSLWATMSIICGEKDDREARLDVCRQGQA